MTTVLAIFACFLLLVSIFPLVRSDYWTFRAMEYPRLQKWMMSVLTLIVWSSMTEPSIWLYWPLNAALIAVAVYQSYLIFPYLPIARREVGTVQKEHEAKTESQLSLLIANVYQYNRQTDKLQEYLKRLQPDIILLLETDAWWQEAMSRFQGSYPYRIEVPQENTYGMLFFSQLPLREPEVRRLIETEIPSIRTWVQLPDGQEIRLFGLHPKLPAPSESIRTTEKDQELLMVAGEAADFKGPVIVAGDLNDVAWSYTTELFQKMSRLLDPRKGRGFFNTFPAKYPLMRFPLDHIFCSDHFRLIRLRRLSNIGSDHFPIFVQLHCALRHTASQPTPEPEKADKELAADKMQRG